MPATFTRILFPTDFSDDAKNAFAYARALAEQYGAELLLLHVVEDIVLPSYFGAQQAPVYISTQELEDAAATELERLLTDEERQRLKARTIMRRGTPYLEIVAAAEDEGADLIVMGTHGHSGVAHALLGSTTERVVRKARVPVLTIRHGARGDGS